MVPERGWVAGTQPSANLNKVMICVDNIKTDNYWDLIDLFSYAYNMSKSDTKHCLKQGGFYINNIKVDKNEMLILKNTVINKLYAINK